jgi:signal transduction histidine kinase
MRLTSAETWTSVSPWSADSLLSVINDIFDLTRVESGKLELEYFDFDVNATAWGSLRISTRPKLNLLLLLLPLLLLLLLLLRTNV